MGDLTTDDLEFLYLLERLLRRGERPTRSKLPLADRKQDRIRQKCSKLGLAKWRYGYWQLTKSGLDLIRDRRAAKSDPQP